VPHDWIGELRYRGTQQVFARGDVFCTEAGEAHSTTRIELAFNQAVTVQTSKFPPADE